MKWTPEAEATLQDLKTYLSSAPTLVAPKPQEPLLLYLAATDQVVSAALVAQREVDEAESEQGPTESDKDQGRSEHDSCRGGHTADAKGWLKRGGGARAPPEARSA